MDRWMKLQVDSLLQLYCTKNVRDLHISLSFTIQIWLFISKNMSTEKNYTNQSITNGLRTILVHLQCIMDKSPIEKS